MNLVEIKRRTNLSDESLKDHLFCYYNNKFIEFWPTFLQKHKNADFILGDSRISVSEQQIFAVSDSMTALCNTLIHFVFSSVLIFLWLISWSVARLQCVHSCHLRWSSPRLHCCVASFCRLLVWHWVLVQVICGCPLDELIFYILHFFFIIHAHYVIATIILIGSNTTYWWTPGFTTIRKTWKSLKVINGDLWKH